MNQNYSQPPDSYGNYAPTQRQMTLPYKQPIKKYSNAIGLSLALLNIFLIVLYLVLYLAFSLFPLQQADQWADLVDQVASFVSYIVAFWLATLILTARIGIPSNVAFPMRLPKAGIAIPAIFVALGSSVLGSIVVNLLSYLIETTTGLVPSMPDFTLPAGLAANIIFIIRVAIAPAIFEEMLFRGVVMQSLRRFGDGFALATSAILFGLLHGNLIQGPNAILLGVVIGYFVLRTGSLFTGMLIHLVNNSISVLFMYLAEMLTTRQEEILNYAVVGFYVLTGCAALLFLIIRHQNLFHLAPSNYPLRASQKVGAFYTAPLQVVFLLMILVMTALAFE